jgi:phage-related minor tail protein
MVVMQDDKRMIELLAEMLHEIKGLRTDFHRMEREQGALTSEVKDIKSDLHRNTNAFWEQSQMLQKVIWEPAQQHAQRLAQLEERVAQIELRR